MNSGEGIITFVVLVLCLLISAWLRGKIRGMFRQISPELFFQELEDLVLDFNNPAAEVFKGKVQELHHNLGLDVHNKPQIKAGDSLLFGSVPVGHNHALCLERENHQSSRCGS